jgi:hypothetical protein
MDVEFRKSQLEMQLLGLRSQKEMLESGKTLAELSGPMDKKAQKTFNKEMAAIDKQTARIERELAELKGKP